MKKSIKTDAGLWKKAAWDMLYLTECGINVRLASPERVAQMDLDKVYALSCSQSLEAITFLALERLIKQNIWSVKEDVKQVFAKWEESKNKVIRKAILMNAEREQLFLYMEQQKIWHLPLKGAVLYSLYPEFGMRQMADNDILFDPSFRQAVREWFAARGYMVESYMESNHDEYHKEPVYNFEMHTSLFYEESYPQMYQYYCSLKDRLLPVPGREFEYRMSEEDFYIYLLAHEYKHYSNNGTGLRSLLDLYVFNKAKNNLDHQYLKDELLKTGLYDFEKEMKELALKVFAPEADYNALTNEEQQLLCTMLYGRTYGMIENYWKKQLKEMCSKEEISGKVKMKYLFSRIFPGRTHMKKWCELYAPLILKHPWLMPTARILRFIRLRGEKRKMIKKEFRTVRKI